MKTRRLTTLALLSAIALTIFMVEAQIPPLVPIPGVKLGLANIVTVCAVFALGPLDAVLILGYVFSWGPFSPGSSAPSFSPPPGVCAPF